MCIKDVGNDNYILNWIYWKKSGNLSYLLQLQCFWYIFRINSSWRIVSLSFSVPRNPSQSTCKLVSTCNCNNIINFYGERVTSLKSKCTASYDQKHICKCIRIFIKFYLLSGFLGLHSWEFFREISFSFFVSPNISFAYSRADVRLPLVFLMMPVAPNLRELGCKWLSFSWFPPLVVVNDWNYHASGNTGSQRSHLLVLAPERPSFITSFAVMVSLIFFFSLNFTWNWSFTSHLLTWL